MQPVFLKNFKTALDRAEVLRMAGYPRGSRVPASIERLLDQTLGEAVSLAVPAAVYRLFNPSVSNEGVSLPDGPQFRSKGLASLLGGAELACLFVVTVGPAIGATARVAMGEGKFTRSVLLDAAGSACVEAAADEVQESVSRNLGGRSVTRRYSPGYCDWALAEQVKIFDSIPAGEIGVTLDSSLFMEPEKSVSAVFGIGRSGDELFGRGHRPPCRTCTLKTCKHRVEDK
jgi:hypothetical protein